MNALYGEALDLWLPVLTMSVLPTLTVHSTLAPAGKVPPAGQTLTCVRDSGIF